MRALVGVGKVEQEARIWDSAYRSLRPSLGEISASVVVGRDCGVLWLVLDGVEASLGTACSHSVASLPDPL